MDHQFAANKWFPKREEQNINQETDLRFNPFPAEHFPDFPSTPLYNQNQNQTQIPHSTSTGNVLNSYPSSLTQRTPIDHRNNVVPSFNTTISFAAATAVTAANNSKSMPKSNNGNVKSGVVERVAPVQISFSTSSSAPTVNTNAPASFEEFYGAMEYDEVPIMKSGGPGRTSLQCQEHILAERKRREKLSKSFIALSAIVPGLKKLDKASVLDGAIKYLKKLELQIKNMEENTTVSNKRTTRGQSDSGGGGGGGGDDGGINTTVSPDIENNVIKCSNQDLNQPSSPEIDVKISGGDVLIRIFCQKIDGIFKEILFKVDSLDLSIVNSSASPFGKFNLYIAILAQTEGDSCMSCEGLAKYIREVVQDFI